MTRIGARKLRMSSGKVRTFRSTRARDEFERIAQAVKHGFKPKRSRKRAKTKKSGKRA